MTTPATPAAGRAGVEPGAPIRSAAHGDARRAARNTAWGLVGIVLPLVAGLAAIPVLADALGPARFGLVGIAWAVLEYLALLDAGLGRATVHLVARRLRAREGVPGDLVTTSVLAQAALGVAAGLLLAAAAPAMADRVLDVPPALRGEAIAAFRVLAATVPLVLVAVALRGILEAADRFDLAAAVRVPASTATFVVPAAMAAGGATVPAILAALLVVRLLACLASLVLLARCLPAVRWARPAGLRRVGPLLTFGGWIAVSNVLSPIFLLLDRLVLGAVVGVVAVGYYTAPYEAAVRLLVFPAALAAAIFPAMSALAAAHADGERAPLAAYYGGAVRAAAAPMLALAAVGIALAPDLLAAWLGAPFADASGTAARLLLAGVAANAIAHVPATAVQALGRPDVTARLHLAEAAVHVPLTVALVYAWGIPGAAAAWALRAAVDAILVSRAAHRLLGVRLVDLVAGRAPHLAVALAGVVAAAVGVRAVAAHAPAAMHGSALVAGLAAIGVAYAAAVWWWLMSSSDRAALRAAIRREP